MTPGQMFKKQMSRKTVLIPVCVFAALGLIGLLWWLYNSQFEQTDDATLVGHVMPVSAKISGTVQQVLVSDNQEVKAGQLLLVLDPQDSNVSLSQALNNVKTAEAQAKTALSTVTYTEQHSRAALTEAQGNYAASVATLEKTRHAVTEAGEAVNQSEYQLQQAEANFQKAKSDFSRYQNTNPDAVSAQQVEAAATALKSAQAQRDAAKASLAQSQARLAEAKSVVSETQARITQSKGGVQTAQAQTLQSDVSKSQYESAQAALAAARDQYNQAKLNAGYTRIYAMSSGRIGRKTVEMGQHIQAGEFLMAVVSPDIWVVANYKETQLGRMRPGQPVDIDVDAFPSHHFKGRLDSFSPGSGATFALLPPENATGNFTKIVQRIPVKVLLEPKSLEGYQHLLVPGMSALVSVHVNEPGEDKKPEKRP